jgi:hypothetical protein
VATVICDIDGVLAYPVNDYREYSSAQPNLVMRDVLRRLRQQGDKIVLHTSRWKEDRQVTEEWLSQHGFPYTEIVFGKPLGDIYIDDKAMRIEAGEEERFLEILHEINRRRRGGH